MCFIVFPAQVVPDGMEFVFAVREAGTTFVGQEIGHQEHYMNYIPFV